MEHKVNDIINYNHNGKTIYLKVIEDLDCKNCFFYSTVCCSDIRNDVGDCLSIRRSDKTPIVFKKVNNKIMNENIDLTKILKNCPKDWEFYHLIYNKVYFVCIDKDSEYPIRLSSHTNDLPSINISKDGKHIKDFDGECLLLPSKEQRDWSKFTAPWYKKDKFDPKMFKPFDKVLVRHAGGAWDCDFFSYIRENLHCPYVAIGSCFNFCIPYNDDTKHLVGTTDEAPEYYRYWED